jgi:hypothetical protein
MIAAKIRKPNPGIDRRFRFVNKGHSRVKSRHLQGFGL